MFAIASAALLLHSPARGKKTYDSFDEHFDDEPVKSRKAGIGKIVVPQYPPQTPYLGYLAVIGHIWVHI